LKGPNYTWHIDGHDKLAKWGFYIHGAVDGFSRKVLWLNVFVTNKDPWLTAKYFIEAVIKYEGKHIKIPFQNYFRPEYVSNQKY